MSVPLNEPGPLETVMAAAGASFEARLAVVEQRVLDHHAELAQTRARLHHLEAERAAVQLLTQELKRTREEMARMQDDFHEFKQDLREEMREVARQIARDITESVLERRDETEVAVGGRRRSAAVVAIQLGQLLVAAISVLALVVLGLLR